MLYEVLDFVELKDETDTTDPYIRDVYSTPPSAADRIVGRKDKAAGPRQSPTSVLFPESYDMGVDLHGAADPASKAAEYFDRHERGASPVKEAAQSPLGGRGKGSQLPGSHQVWDLSSASPSMGGMGMQLGGAGEEGHQRRRGGGLLGLIKWGIIFGGVGAVWNHFHSRGGPPSPPSPAHPAKTCQSLPPHPVPRAPLPAFKPQDPQGHMWWEDSGNAGSPPSSPLVPSCD